MDIVDLVFHSFIFKHWKEGDGKNEQKKFIHLNFISRVVKEKWNSFVLQICLFGWSIPLGLIIIIVVVIIMIQNIKITDKNLHHHLFIIIIITNLNFNRNIQVFFRPLSIITIVIHSFIHFFESFFRLDEQSVCVSVCEHIKANEGEEETLFCIKMINIM